MEELQFQNNKEKYKKSRLLQSVYIFLLLILIFYFLIDAPKREKDTIIHISKNDNISSVSNILKNENIIKSRIAFKVLIILFNQDKNISTGDYLFKKDINIFSVVWQISSSKHYVSPIKITLKEGLTKEQMANVLVDKVSSFRKDLFLKDERSKEGYLFPDTYFFFPMSTTDEILDEISSNFNKKIKTLNNDIEKSGKGLSEIIIMASIIEKEASGKEDAFMISGILWKRIEIGMPLQADAAPITYEKSGLPDEAISNPGLLSIKAALNPAKTDYLFYLHDDYGKVHYAKDFSEHRSNISKYLK